jgi:hypothetical protein
MLYRLPANDSTLYNPGTPGYLLASPNKQLSAPFR